MIGNGKPNLFQGFDGNDHLEGRGGNDDLYAGDGTDLADGGGGTDDFCMNAETALNCERTLTVRQQR